MAFRKRLKSWGYTDIKIKRIRIRDDQNYYVYAIEPLGKIHVRAEYNIEKMNNSFRR
jgi:hypothetical protein